MRGVGLCVCLLLLLLTEGAMCQGGRGLGGLAGLAEGGEEGEGREAEPDPASVNILNPHGLPGSYRPVLRKSRSRRPPPPAPKRTPPGSRYALSLDVPTNILNVLIDLAKNRELRTKAAANAQLMARIGRRK